MRLTVSAQLYRAWEISCRIGHAISRGCALTEALVGVTIGSGIALASAALLRLPDAGLMRLTRELTGPGASVPVELPRTVLLIVVFFGLIWAAGACRRTREWFNPPVTGGWNG